MSDVPGSDQISNIATAGRNAVGSFDPTATANSLNKGFSALKSNQVGTGPQNATDYMSAYANTVAANPSVTNLYNKANDMFNVPQLQTQATNLTNQVNQAVPQAYNLARGFDYNDAQVQNQANTNLRFLQPASNAATANANTASGLASNYVQAGQTQNAQNLLPIQSYGPMLNDAMARESTGYTQDAANQFAALTAKMQAGVQLSQSEMQSLTSLTQAKEQYDAAIAGSQAQVQSAQIGAGTALSPTQTYYNPFYTAQTYNPNRRV